MKTFLIDEELRDKLILAAESGIVEVDIWTEYCEQLRNLLESGVGNLYGTVIDTLGTPYGSVANTDDSSQALPEIDE
jgi:hypothetical protein